MEPSSKNLIAGNFAWPAYGLDFTFCLWSRSHLFDEVILVPFQAKTFTSMSCWVLIWQVVLTYVLLTALVDFF